MFEHSLLESSDSVRTSKGWTTTLSFTIQAAILAAVILVARFDPQKLFPAPIDIGLVAPPLPPIQTMPLKLPRMKSSADTQSISTSAPNNAVRRMSTTAEGAAPASNFSAFANSMANTSVGSSAVGLNISTTTAKASVSSGPVRISSGTTAANCVSCPPPLYPAAAKAVRVSGTVILAAVISTRGTVENLRVVSGPPLLRNAAMDAARNWRYKPTVLSGQPVAVETEITVVFHLD